MFTQSNTGFSHVLGDLNLDIGEDDVVARLAQHGLVRGPVLLREVPPALLQDEVVLLEVRLVVLAERLAERVPLPGGLLLDGAPAAVADHLVELLALAVYDSVFQAHVSPPRRRRRPGSRS